MSSLVSRPPAADSARALGHFENLLEFETDCWDVHYAITNNRKDFVLLDVRGEELYNKGHGILPFSKCPELGNDGSYTLI